MSRVTSGMKINLQAFSATINTVGVIAGFTWFVLVLVWHPLLTLAGTTALVGIYAFWAKRLR